ncbi:MAG: FtsQ-type POTRA domain-containing protein [Gordonia sp. (in: high G+C Gram-positive bacteria)]
MARRPRVRARGARIILTVVLAVLVVGGLVLVAYFTPLMSVRSTDIRGNKVVSGEQIGEVAAVATGTPLLQVDTEAVARRVAAIPQVESARVQRGYPSTLTVTVVERTPVALVREGDRVHVLDRSGVGYLTLVAAQAPAAITRLPVFHTSTPGPADPTTKAALGVVASLPADLRGQILTVTASSPVDIEFGLRRDRTVIWGDDSRTADKARTLGYLLTRRASEYNVSSPDFPAYR